MRLEEKKAAVFPYNFEFTPLLRFNIFGCRDYSLYSPLSWSLCYKDASYADGGLLIGNIVQPLSDNITSDCDILIIPDCVMSQDVFDKVIKLVYSFLKANKMVICLHNCFDLLPSEILIDQRFFSYKKIIEYSNTDLISTSMSHSKLSEINTPIVLVCGLLPDINKFDVQLMVISKLEKLGKKVSFIGSKKYLELIGWHSYPEEYINTSSADNVYRLNKLIYDINNTECPDIFVMGLPGGVMAYSDSLPNDFGINAYTFFNAIQPDYIILCLPNTNITSEYLNLLQNLFKYRFNTYIQTFLISNRSVDSKPYLKGNEFNPIVYDYKYIGNKTYDVIKKCNEYDIITIEDMYARDEIRQRMISFLMEHQYG